MDSKLHGRLHQLGDLELAILVALVSEQHCIFSCSSARSTPNLADELGLICSNNFVRQVARIDCSPQTNVDEFSEAILVDVLDDYEDSFDYGNSSRQHSSVVESPPPRIRSSDRLGSLSNTLDNRRIADVIIATNLDQASENVQIQTLELLRTKRIFTRTALHLAPKSLVFVAVVSKPGARLTHHLNDMFAMSHLHSESDGFPHVENQQDTSPKFDSEDIKMLHDLALDVHVTAEMAGYLHNVAIFMRMSRYVKGGVTASATRNLRLLAQTLAPLHGMNFLSPSLITLAARKVYPHRLILATPQTERSLQWGSDPDAVREMLDGLTIDTVIEEVLASVDTPL